MKQSTAVAHPNLAFVKYWGKVDADLNIPSNGSISMNLSSAKTVTSVTFDETLKEDVISIDDEKLDNHTKPAVRVSKHLDLLRELAHTSVKAHVTTNNNFPMGTGFASSASGFAALTLAGADALELKLNAAQLSILARRGSGSACRSIPDGFVEWLAGTDNDSSYALEVAPPHHWDIIDIAVVVSTKEKDISSSLGHKLAQKSPFWPARGAIVENRLQKVRQAIQDRDFKTFGCEIESEALELHAIAMTSAHDTDLAWQSGIFYWEPDTLRLIRAVQEWRADGIEVYFTLDAGPTVHLICRQDQKEPLIDRIERLRGDNDWQTVISEPAMGARIIQAAPSA